MVLESKRLVWIHPKWEIRLLNSMKVFETSAKEGYGLLAHAGEEGPAEYVWKAIDGLKI